jgi:hypothetical protein
LPTRRQPSRPSRPCWRCAPTSRPKPPPEGERRHDRRRQER